MLFCGAVTIKSYSDDVERAINDMVEGLPDGVAFSQADSQQLLERISQEWPLVGYYVNMADFSGHTPATIASAMADGACRRAGERPWLTSLSTVFMTTDRQWPPRRPIM